MFKFLVAVFFIKHLVNMITNNMIVRGATLGHIERIKDNIIKNNSTKIDKEEKTSMELGVFVCYIPKLIMWLLEIVLVIYMIKYDTNTYITLGYLLLFVISLIVVKFKKPKNDVMAKYDKYSVEYALTELDKLEAEWKRVTFKSFISRLIRLAYWSYAVYIIFVI